MGRLINTDNLIGCAIIKPMTSEEFGHILACENKIVHDDIPTAFDVEAVVKDIQDIGTRFCASVHCNDECECCDHGSMMKAIIEIVRNGGVK